MSTRADRTRRWASLAVTAASGFAGLGYQIVTFIEIPEGGQLVSFQEGVMAAVSVVEDAAGVARLRINNRQQEGSSATRRVDARQAWLPLLLHPAPSEALFLGLGTGVTSASAAEDPSLNVDVVELLPEVIAASTRFTADRLAGSAASRFHVLAADARRFVRVSARKYDVIVSDNFHPARSGSGALYTVEHFAAVREREMLAQVREPLLSVLRISPDFRPAYDPLLAMSQALARTDVVGARTLLAELTRLQPARSEAPQSLARLGSAGSSAEPVRH